MQKPNNDIETLKIAESFEIGGYIVTEITGITGVSSLDIEKTKINENYEEAAKAIIEKSKNQ